MAIRPLLCVCTASGTSARIVAVAVIRIGRTRVHPPSTSMSRSMREVHCAVEGDEEAYHERDGVHTVEPTAAKTTNAESSRTCMYPSKGRRRTEDSGRMSQARAFPPEPAAPWAEAVPGAPAHMTLAEFLDYRGEDGYRSELVEGVLVRMVGSRPRANNVTMRLLVPLSTYVTAHGLGQVTPPDAVYDFEQTGQKDTGLLPDIGFYHAHREPLVDPDNAYPFAPDLAVEIASPKQYRPEMATKASRYLDGGTALVWVVWPKRREVDVWRPGGNAPTTVGVGDALDGEDVVPGFTYQVAALFA